MGTTHVDGGGLRHIAYTDATHTTIRVSGAAAQTAHDFLEKIAQPHAKLTEVNGNGFTFLAQEMVADAKESGQFGMIYYVEQLLHEARHLGLHH